MCTLLLREKLNAFTVEKPMGAVEQEVEGIRDVCLT